MQHTRGRPYHPMTQGKIERYHRSMKNVVRLENLDSPWVLDRAVTLFVDYYNQERLHGGRREAIKRLALQRRKKENLRNAA